MINNISTKLYKLNFKEITNNATNKKYWTKKWEIFNYGGISVEFSLSTIDISQNKLYCRLKLSGGLDIINSWSCYNLAKPITIPLQSDHFNQLALDKELCGKVNELFLNLGCRELSFSDKYDDLRDLENDFEYKLRDIAEKFLDSENITNKEIRDMYIENYIDNNSADYTSSYIEENKYNKFVEHRATFCYIMNYKEKAESIISLSNCIDSDWIFDDAEELKRKIEEDELEEYEELLEDI